MKKTIYLFVILTIFACSNDDQTPTPTPPKTCVVEKYTAIRYVTLNADNSVNSDTGFIENGYFEPYSKDCNDCGKILAGRTQHYAGGYYEFQYRLKCK